MKKIFTLLFAVGMVSLAQAQYGGNRDNRQNDQHIYQQNDQRSFNTGYGNDRRFDDKDFSFDRGRKMEIARINQKYDLKIQMVMRNWFMSRFEKQRQIRFLQEQRQRELSMVYSRGYDRRDRWDDHDNRSRDRW